MTQKTIGLLLVGGKHHVLHLVPISAGFQKIENLRVVIFVTSLEEKQACARVLDGLDVTSVDIRVLKTNKIAKRLSPKLAFLMCNLKHWKVLDAIITVERTSTILRYILKNLPPFIHIPHGAGDRAKSYDARIRHFDHVLVAGDKDKKRMLELGLVAPETCHVTGYMKPFVVRKISPPPTSLFDNSNPVVLYCPHFSKELSSWSEFGKPLLDAFSKQKDFNFIFAPHVRLFSGESHATRAYFEAFDGRDNIHIDLGSARSNDMSYTRAADIYVGDVSSQVYEFLSEPKPCVFVAHEGTQWKGNPDYAHWQYGPVRHSVTEVLQAISEAQDTLPRYAEAQAKGCRAAKGDPAWNPIERAAQVVAAILSADY